MEGEETSAAEGTEGSTAGSGGTSAPKALTAKYYSKETQSADDGVFLPEYKELKISLKVGDKECDKDNGVFHAYVGENPGTLTVICDDPDADFTVTRMDDTDYPVQLGINREWGIPTFEGSLMLKIDGTKGQDVTSVFLLVSRDETPPMLTLADPVFFADRDTGEYAVTGTADAGSEIIYGKPVSLPPSLSPPAATAALPFPVCCVERIIPASFSSARGTARATNPRSSWR